MLSSVLKFAVILLAAAVLAVGARAMFIARQQVPVVADAEPTADILVRVAAADLPAGLLLRDNDLDWKPYPRSEVPKGALREDSPQAELVGVLLRNRLEAGEPIIATNIIRPDAPGFLAAALKPGMRAVSVPIDDVSGHAGLIMPGDYVDMILTQNIRQENELDGRRASVVSETVVENVRVIAVGTSFQPQRDDQAKPARARTVTVEVDPRAAEAVTVAAQLGTLSMALRSFALDDRNDAANQETGSVVAWDADRLEARPVWGGDVSRALRAAIPRDSASETKPDRSREVLILRGSDRQEQKFDTTGGVERTAQGTTRQEG